MLGQQRPDLGIRATVYPGAEKFDCLDLHAQSLTGVHGYLA